MKKSRLLYSVLPFLVLAMACGGGSKSYDHSGFAEGDDDLSVFTRACQQYLRGSLSNSKETFSSLIYRFPESPLNSDAQIAVRRIESELTGVIEIPVESNGSVPVNFPSVAIVGTPSVFSTVSQLEALIVNTGSPPLTIEDSGAPDVTLVLYSDGFQDKANIVSDSLSSWLSSHSSVPVQPGGDIIVTIAPGHSGVVIVIGTDAVIDTSVLHGHSIVP